MINNKLILTAIIGISLSGCTSSRPYQPSAAETAAAARTVDSLNYGSAAPTINAYRAAPIAAKRAVAPVVSDRISAGDILDVNVFKVPDLSAKALTVEPSGMISLPLIGSMKVAGLSITQAEQSIKQSLTQFMQAPQVSISRTNKAVEKRVTVEGEVRTPGVFPIKGNLSFLQAIALAQGLTELGDSRTVYFYRDGTRHLVNLDLVRNGTISDPILRGDDRIVVMKDVNKVREKKVLDYLPAVTAPFSIFN